MRPQFQLADEIGHKEDIVGIGKDSTIKENLKKKKKKS